MDIAEHKYFFESLLGMGYCLELKQAYMISSFGNISI